MALRLALQNPTQFAAAVSIHGKFPAGHSPLANLNQARKLPLMFMQGLHAQEETVAKNS